MIKSLRLKIFISLAIIALTPLSAFASTGTIDSTNKYAWGEKLGWVNFNPTNGSVQVTDSGITGNIWSANYGWINLSPANGGVKNDGHGNLSDMAWGSNIGWVDFSGVKINSNGVFSGTSTTDSLGSLTFDCANCKVSTSWRPTVASSGGGVVYPSIYQVTVATTTATSALITWRTDYNTTATVVYGTSTAYGLSKVDQTAATTHSLLIDNLTPAASYQFRVKAVLNGITTTSSNYAFTTLANPVVSITPTVTPVSTPTTTENQQANNNLSYPSGTLVSDRGAIYLIIGQTKLGFASMKAFTGLGYSLKNVVKGNASAYSLSKTILKSATQAHPDGSWIISGKVVFYVSASGYIPVPSWDIFLSNGGKAQYIVKANRADLKDKRPIASPMTANDNRL